MPLTEKGTKIKRAMKKTYGAKKGKAVFHASKEKGTIKGVKKEGNPMPAKTGAVDVKMQKKQAKWAKKDVKTAARRAKRKTVTPKREARWARKDVKKATRRTKVTRKLMERKAKKGLKKAFPDKKTGRATGLKLPKGRDPQTGRHTGLVLPKKAKRR